MSGFKSPQALTQAAFDAQAGSKFYHLQSALRGGIFNAEFLANAVQSMCEPPLSFGTVLEVGAGLGDKTPLLHEILRRLGCEAPRITGIDFSAASLAFASARHNHGVNYEVMDFFGDGLGDRTFDYVFLAAVFHHFVDMRKAVQKILQHLNPRGVALILNTFYPESLLLRPPAHLLQRFYREIMGRGRAYYNSLTVETVKTLIEETEGLVYHGDVRLDFPLTLINTRLLVAQRLGNPVQ